jgi:hypothetical protein
LPWKSAFLEYRLFEEYAEIEQSTIRYGHHPASPQPSTARAALFEFGKPSIRDLSSKIHGVQRLAVLCSTVMQEIGHRQAICAHDFKQARARVWTLWTPADKRAGAG